MITRLMISVRSVSEAMVALHNGADLIDIKEPKAGPLGMAPPHTIRTVVQEIPPQVPIGLSLGELWEWLERPGAAPFLHEGIAYAKVGLSRLGGAVNHLSRPPRISTPPDLPLGEARGGVRSWRDDFRRWREAAVAASGTGWEPTWVAVAYADWEIAGSPPPEEVLELAGDGFGALLIDTFRKDSVEDALFRGLDEAALRGIVLEAQARGLEVVLAGALSPDGVERAALLAPDAIGVRSAACRDRRRESSLDPQAVRILSERMRSLRVPQASR